MPGYGDQLNDMIAWEEGELGDEETIRLFQALVDSGLVWRLQGCYGRQAGSLIEAGYVHIRRTGGAESQRELEEV
jgi:hypothetical protein